MPVDELELIDQAFGGDLLQGRAGGAGAAVLDIGMAISELLSLIAGRVDNRTTPFFCGAMLTDPSESGGNQATRSGPLDERSVAWLNRSRRASAGRLALLG
jgi:hypothetical protein